MNFPINGNAAIFPPAAFIIPRIAMIKTATFPIGMVINQPMIGINPPTTLMMRAANRGMKNRMKHSPLNTLELITRFPILLYPLPETYIIQKMLNFLTKNCSFQSSELLRTNKKRLNAKPLNRKLNQTTL